LETDVPKSRIYGLDILRAAAISYVMVSHASIYSTKFVDLAAFKWLILDGVSLFFVLSGFLIGGILIRHIEKETFGLKQLRHFWMRRWLRTLPAYFCVLTFLIACYYYSHQQLPPNWMKYYFFLQNFSTPHPLFFTEAWSLSVEEWFYVLIPLTLFFLLQLPGKKKNLIFGCILFVIVLVTSIRLFKVVQHDYFGDGNFGDQIMKVVLTRLDAIMYGVLAAWLAYYYSEKFYAHKNSLFVLGVLGLLLSNVLFSEFFLTRLQLSLVPLATGCLLPALSSLKEGKGIVFQGITFMSTLSYSMYLTNHMIVLRGIMPFLTKGMKLEQEGHAWQNFFAYVLFWSFTFISAYVLHRVIEKPFMAFRERLKSTA